METHAFRFAVWNRHGRMSHFGFLGIWKCGARVAGVVCPARLAQ
jgi:hypothetical protein